MIKAAATFLVFGASGGTGQHFLQQALHDGHTVRALVRTPAKLQAIQQQYPTALHLQQGSITDVQPSTMDDLVKGADYVVCMLGDKEAQRTKMINHEFVTQHLVPAMRRHNVKRFLYQAGAFTKPAGGSLSPLLWILRYTIATDYAGQHTDNYAVAEYLYNDARDIEWMIHRAGISGESPSKGTLQLSLTDYSVGNFVDCANFNYRTVQDAKAVHTQHFSHYVKGKSEL